MNKKRLVTMVSGMALMVSAMTTVVFAEYREMGCGCAYFYSNSINGMKYVDTGAVPGDSEYYAAVYLETAYENGDLIKEQSGPKRSAVQIKHGYEWALDYSSKNVILDAAKEEINAENFSG